MEGVGLADHRDMRFPAPLLALLLASSLAAVPASASAQDAAPPTGLGTALADILNGSPLRDVINALDGNDTINGGVGDDELDGASGNDTIDGGPGADDLLGRSGADILIGGPGTDTLEGGSDNDRIEARDGEIDQITCGSGYDVVIADAKDAVASDCEVVSTPKVAKKKTKKKSARGVKR
jgi:Ca2+-binding RTX toxin-like protein